MWWVGEWGGGRGRVRDRDRVGDWGWDWERGRGRSKERVFLERDFLSSERWSEMHSMSMSDTLPKRLTDSLGAPSFEGLWALGLSA